MATATAPKNKGKRKVKAELEQERQVRLAARVDSDLFEAAGFSFPADAYRPWPDRLSLSEVRRCGH